MSIPRFSTDRDDHHRRSRNVIAYHVVAAGLLCLLLVLPHAADAQCPCVTQASGFAGGDGSPGDPYQVCSPAHLDNVRNHLSSHFLQIADIDMSGFGNFAPIGATAAPFQGSYDGNQLAILNLTITKLTPGTGLFVKLSLSSSVLNLTLDLITVTGIQNCGAVGGFIQGLIDSVHVSGNINCISSTGLLGGQLDGGTVSRSSAIGSVSVEGNFGGGLIGEMFSNASVDNSSAQVIVISTKGNAIGGLVGAIGDSTMSNNYSNGTVQAPGLVGGLVGFDFGNSLVRAF